MESASGDLYFGMLTGFSNDLYLAAINNDTALTILGYRHPPQGGIFFWLISSMGLFSVLLRMVPAVPLSRGGDLPLEGFGNFGEK